MGMNYKIEFQENHDEYVEIKNLAQINNCEEAKETKSWKVPDFAEDTDP
jgi:hypothetical protein